MSDAGLPPPPAPVTPGTVGIPSQPISTPSEPLITQEDRTMAVLAHALQTVGWFIAPLVILIMKRDSRFVSFHALQALLLQVAYVLMWVVFAVIWFAAIFGTLAQGGAQANQPPPLIFMFFPLIWLAGMAFWIFMIVVVVVYSIKAGRGEWAGYPLLGRLAKRILGL
jgi:uncharacterized protein